MPVVVAPEFRPPAFLRSAHMQTILPALLRRRLGVTYQHERLELSDGDFLDLDWARCGEKNPRLAILTHGLEGDANAGYIRGIAAALGAAGWD
ncbi:MAG: alpha/beta hydrolase, partial [Verrucomicrobia bacterium]|nr:alpha/beta hydrolase [Verrucomicrobiota bacterium]